MIVHFFDLVSANTRADAIPSDTSDLEPHAPNERIRPYLYNNGTRIASFPPGSRSSPQYYGCLCKRTIVRLEGRWQ